MHELSIAQSIIHIVERHIKKNQVEHVRVVRLQIGEASGIKVDALQWSFSLLAELLPQLQGAYLQIEQIPHRAYCQQCQQDFAVKEYIPRCPQCNEWSADILSGTELQILEMETDEPTWEEEERTEACLE